MQFNLNLEDIRYVKILCKSIEGSTCLIKTAIKKIDERELLACIKVDEGPMPQYNQEVTLSIICQDGLYRTKTNLISSYTDDKYRYIQLETPRGLEYQQNREYFRIMADYNCAYYLKIGEDVKTLTAKTYDISANGVSIILPIHAFSEEDSEIEMMIDEKIVRAQIRYVRSEKHENGYKLSFTYTSISDKDRDYISRICIQKQLEMRRRTAN